jgi:NADPH:quinone reductase-like Zn-dependent oxidoreductase
VDALLNAAALGPEILGALGDGGMLVAVRDWPGATERDIAIRRILVSAYLDNPAPLEDIRAALAAGTIRPNVADVFSPHDAADAHRRLEAGGVRGRLVFDLSSWHSER